MLPVFIMAIENDDDRTFVAELYARCQPAMQRRALSILKNESDAEEAVHEAILRVIRHLEKVRMIPRDEVLYYLVTVTETASIDLYRKRQRESRATIGNENDWAEHLTDDNTAEQTMLRLEQRELLERCLAHLPQREIDLLNYYYILELPYKEISWCVMQTKTVRAANCRFPSISWGKSSLPAGPFRTSPAVSV